MNCKIYAYISLYDICHTINCYVGSSLVDLLNQSEQIIRLLHIKQSKMLLTDPKTPQDFFQYSAYELKILSYRQIMKPIQVVKHYTLAFTAPNNAERLCCIALG